MAAITEKQKRFAEEWLKDLNGTQAAIRAGYSPKTAGGIASEYLRKPHIRDYINERRRELQRELGIDQKRVLEEYAKIGFADIRDFLDYHVERRQLEDASGTPYVDVAVSVTPRDSIEIEGGAVQEVSIGKDGTFKFRLYNKQGALDKIGQHLGLFEPQASGDYEDLTPLAEMLNNEDTDADD